MGETLTIAQARQASGLRLLMFDDAFSDNPTKPLPRWSFP